MKRILMVSCMVLFLVNPILAGEVTVKWEANPEADITGYKVYKSEDLGQTWAVVDDTNTTTSTLTLPDDKLILLRVSAYDSSGQETIRVESGVWYNGLWKPPLKPKGFGVE